MGYQPFILLLVLALGVLGKNALITYSTAGLLIFSLLPFKLPLQLLANQGIPIGLTFLTLAMLAPLALGDLDLPRLLATFTNPIGLSAILGGLLAAWLSARGVELLTARPEVVLALILGTLIGTSFLQGIPVGPLFAAGLTALFVRLLEGLH